MSFLPPSIGTVLKICAILIACALIYVFLFPLPLSLLGYYPGGVGWDVAQKIVDANGEASDCRKIIHLISQPFSPTEDEQRSSCIYTYAELTKDPSACELLMSSSYGLSCTGAAKDFKRPCALGNDRSVSGDGIDATLAECVRGTANMQNNRCCIIAKARFITSFNDCSDVNGNQDMKDQCYYSLAFKNNDPEPCASIQHENLRKACIVEASALKQAPSICSGCVPAITLEAASAP